MTTIPIVGTGPTVNRATGNSGIDSLLMAGAFRGLLRNTHRRATLATHCAKSIKRCLVGVYPNLFFSHGTNGYFFA